MKHLIVLGSTGQLARELIAQAPKAGWRVTSLDRATADFTDPDAVCPAVDGAMPADAVINAIAYTAVDKAEEDEAAARLVNAVTPGRVAALCAERGVPFLHVSTDYVFPGDGDRPLTETDPVGPRSVYGATKLEGEQAVAAAAAGGAWLVARTAWVFSPHGKNFVKTMLRVGRERDELSVVDDQIGCPTAADDLAAGLLVAARALSEGQGASGVYHLTGQGETSWAGFADGIFDLAEPVWGRRPDVKRIPSEAYPTPAYRPRNSRLDSSKFREAFGFSASSWPDALARTIAALRASEPELF